MESDRADHPTSSSGLCTDMCAHTMYIPLSHTPPPQKKIPHLLRQGAAFSLPRACVCKTGTMLERVSVKSMGSGKVLRTTSELTTMYVSNKLTKHLLLLLPVCPHPSK